MSEQKGSYDAKSLPGGLEHQLEMLKQQVLMGWRHEEPVLRALGLRDGISLLEMGGGPGFVTEQLLPAMPGGRVTVVELDPLLIERARQYLEGKGDERLEIIEGSVMDTGLPEGSFDMVLGRLIFQHLPDPVRAASEMLRVLKPGGKIVITDIDDRLHVFDPEPEPEMQAINERYRNRQASLGGNRYIGRKLPRILKEAGFSGLEMHTAVLHSEIDDLSASLQRANPELLKKEVEAGFITEDEAALLEAYSERFLSSNPLVMIVMLMASGVKG